MKIFKYLSCLLIILLTCSKVYSQVSPFDTTNYGRNKEIGKFLSTRGFKMYYEVYGKGEPLLFIHGNEGSINNFMFQIPAFSEHYKVIIADSRAQGRSTDNGDSLSYEMITDDINALLDSLHLDSCYVVGWSDGGIEGLMLAMRHPDKVKKLAVTGANLWPDTSAVSPFAYTWAMSYKDSLSALKQTPEIKNKVKLTKLLTNEPHISLNDLHTIKCPSLIIGGDHEIILTQHTMLIAQNIPKSYLWILPGSGHSTPVVFSGLFNYVVGDFFAKPYRKIEGLKIFQ